MMLGVWYDINVSYNQSSGLEDNKSPSKVLHSQCHMTLTPPRAAAETDEASNQLSCTLCMQVWRPIRTINISHGHGARTSPW